MKTEVLFVLATKSIGFAESFAVGYAAFNRKSKEIVKQGYFACPEDEAAGNEADLLWVKKEVVPWLPPPNLTSPVQVRYEFWKAFKAIASIPDWDVSTWVDCGFPVEFSFLRDCFIESQYAAEIVFEGTDVEKHPSYWPWPVHEIATARKAIGLDPLLAYELPPQKRNNPTEECVYIAPLLDKWLSLGE